MSGTRSQNMPAEETPVNLTRNYGRWLMIAGLASALIMGPIVVVNLVSPDGHWELLLPAGIAAALEGILTTNWLARQGRQGNRLLYRVAELMVFLAVLRIATWAVTGTLPNRAALAEFLLQPSRALDLTYVAYVLVTLLAWERAVALSSIFERLAISPAEAAYYDHEGTGGRYQDRPPPIHRSALLQEYYRKWLLGGVLLGVFVALTTFQLPTVRQGELGAFDWRTLGRLGLRTEMLMAVLTYFVGGFWLASQGRLDVVRARWMVDGLTADDQLTGKWRRSSLVFLAMLSAIAALVPVGSTFPITRILQAVFSLAVWLVTLLLGILSYLAYLLTRLLSRPEAAIESREFILPSLPSTGPSVAGEGGEALSLVIGSVFWALAIIGTGLALLILLRSRGVSIEMASLIRAGQGLVKWLYGLWHLAIGGFGAVTATVRSFVDLSRASQQDSRIAWRFLRINRLSPRGKIRYFYLSIVRRAERRGVIRSIGDTPLEFGGELKASWPNVADELDTLTEAFLRARYSAAPVEAGQVGPVKKAWRRVRQRLLRPRSVDTMANTT